MSVKLCVYTVAVACFAWIIVHDGWLIAVGWFALGAAIGIARELWKDIKAGR